MSSSSKQCRFLGFAWLLQGGHSSNIGSLEKRLNSIKYWSLVDFRIRMVEEIAQRV